MINMFTVFSSYIFLSCLIHVVVGKIPHCINVQPCSCFENTGKISCVGETKPLELSKDKLEKITTTLQGPWDLLHIRMTTIEKLPINLFQGKFRKIVIEENDKLASIQDPTFFYNEDVSVTTEVALRKNKNLDIKDFNFLNKLKESLIKLVFDGNKIQKIISGSFDSFPKLELIFLDLQCKGENLTMEISEKAFTNLPVLKQLNLDGNNITEIAKNAIDLSMTKIPKNDELLIYLNNSNIKSISSISIINFSVEKFDGSLMVNLTGNKIKVIRDELIATIAEKGFVFIDQDDITCDCSNVQKISRLLKMQSNKIQSIYQGHKCTAKGHNTPEINITDCAEPEVPKEQQNREELSNI